MSQTPTNPRSNPRSNPRNYCRACGQDFNSLEAFEDHRTGSFFMPLTRRCRSIEELRERGYAVNERGRWYHVARAEAARARLAKVKSS